MYDPRGEHRGPILKMFRILKSTQKKEALSATPPCLKIYIQLGLWVGGDLGTMELLILLQVLNPQPHSCFLPTVLGMRVLENFENIRIAFSSPAHACVLLLLHVAAE